MGWIETVKGMSVLQVGEQLGLKIKGNTMTCPCGCQKRGDSDSRLPVNVWGAGRWKCWSCHNSGDIVDLVAYAVSGQAYKDQSKVREWFEGKSTILVEAKEEELVQLEYPPQEMIQDLWWHKSVEVDGREVSGSDFEVAFADGCQAFKWASKRLGSQAALRTKNLYRRLDQTFNGHPDPKKRCYWMRSGHKALFPMFDADGQMRSMRARQIHDKPGPKSMGIKGYSCARLVLCNRLALEMLRGDAKPGRIVICEGEPALLAWSARQQEAVIGIGSGWWSFEVARKVPLGADVLVATDHDEAGDRYAAQVIEDLKGRATITRWRA